MARYARGRPPDGPGVWGGQSTSWRLLYQFRRPWRDGSTALLLEPVELLERLAALVPPQAAPDVARPADSARSRWPGRLPWASLLRRVFALDVLVCPRCAGPRRILGAVTAPHAVRRLLVALGLAAEPPPGRRVPTA